MFFLSTKLMLNNNVYQSGGGCMEGVMRVKMTVNRVLEGRLVR